MSLKFGDLELATPGDIIVGGGAFACAFAVDAFFFPEGASSVESAGASAIGALALKYATQELLRRLKKTSAPKN